ncbi:hypothetical protein B0H11DRAFT_2185136 [Mycena galericulata]|nr:hypothetical protein B0H11DRAFT_2185136 [Mycena galericulata]
MAQAKARPSQAKANYFGLAWNFGKPKPLQAGPKPWLSGQAKARTSLDVSFRAKRTCAAYWAKQSNCGRTELRETYNYLARHVGTWVTDEDTGPLREGPIEELMGDYMRRVIYIEEYFHQRLRSLLEEHSWDHQLLTEGFILDPMRPAIVPSDQQARGFRLRAAETWDSLLFCAHYHRPPTAFVPPRRSRAIFSWLLLCPMFWILEISAWTSNSAWSMPVTEG